MMLRRVGVRVALFVSFASTVAGCGGGGGGGGEAPAPLEDTTPNVFDFIDQVNVATSTVITSAPVTIGGINATSPISVSGGSYSIGCGSTFTSSPGTISNNQTVCVRHTSAVAANTASNTTLTVGGMADTFTSTTAAPGNTPPVANAGAAQNVVAGIVVTLNGSGSSDANGDSLTYSWTLTSIPLGSAANLAGATSAAPTFTADVAGTYVASLVVNDGQVNSNTATVTVTANEPPPPVLDFYLLGGPGDSVYLGCLTCNPFDSESVCNQFGSYGSQFASLSIWNQFGDYGSQFSSTSPWNQFSSSGPGVYGTDGLYYGVFTVNAFQFNRTQLQSLLSVLNYFSTTNDLAATRTYACGN